MILVPGKFGYVFNPRTGSRSTEEAFLKQVPGAVSIAHHHRYTECDEPVYATVRDPIEIAMSFWWRVHETETLEKWYSKRQPRLFLNLDKVDRYFLYENGLESIFAELGYPDVSLPNIGKQDRPPATEEQRAYLTRMFPDDIELYEQVKRAEKPDV